VAWEDLLQRPGQSDGVADFLLNSLNSASNRRQNDAQTQLINTQLQQKQQAASRDQQFQQAWASYTKNPTPQALIDLQGQFPEKSDALNQIWKAKDQAQKSADFGYLGSVYSAFQNKRPDLAINLLQQRRDADAKAGLDTSVDDDWIKAVTSGDQNAIKYVQGSVLAHLGAADPEGFAKNYGVVDKSKPFDSKVVGPSIGHYEDGPDGKPKWVVDYTAPQLRSVGQGDTLVSVGGGGQASGAPGTGASGPRRVGGYTPRGGENSDAALAGKYGAIKQVAGFDPDTPLGSVADADKLATAIIASEGKPAAKNNVGNIEDGAFARSQPGYSGKDGRWATFDTTANGANAVRNLIRRKYANGFSTVRDVIEGKVVGGDAGAAPQAGGATVVATGAPKQQYQLLTPQETQGLGLDPNVKYQRAPDGQITALGGQSKAQLKPIPQAAAKDIIENRKSLRNIDTALNEIAKYPNGIGPTTGMLGNWVSQLHDPDGVQVRSAVSNIGSLIIHDRSGAAVTVSETPRLLPFIPLVTDPPKVAKEKLARLRAEIGAMNDDYEAQYSEDQGYRPFKGADASSGGMPRPRSIQEARKLPPGTKFIDPNGVVRTR